MSGWKRVPDLERLVEKWGPTEVRAMLKISDYQLEYHIAKAQGRCVERWCSKPAEPDRVRCSKCLKVVRDRRMRPEHRDSKGVCPGSRGIPFDTSMLTLDDFTYVNEDLTKRNKEKYLEELEKVDLTDLKQKP